MEQLPGQLILTEEDNIAWTNKLRNTNELSEQLQILRTRLLADTNVYVKNVGDRVILMEAKDKNKELGICRPTLIVEGNIIELSNNTNAKTVENLTEKLMPDKIKDLEVVEEETAKAIFGTKGRCGVVLLTPRNKKIKKALLQYKR